MTERPRLGRVDAVEKVWADLNAILRQARTTTPTPAEAELQAAINGLMFDLMDLDRQDAKNCSTLNSDDSGNVVELVLRRRLQVTATWRNAYVSQLAKKLDIPTLQPIIAFVQDVINWSTTITPSPYLWSEKSDYGLPLWIYNDVYEHVPTEPQDLVDTLYLQLQSYLRIRHEYMSVARSMKVGFSVGLNVALAKGRTTGTDISIAILHYLKQIHSGLLPEHHENWIKSLERLSRQIAADPNVLEAVQTVGDKTNIEVRVLEYATNAEAYQRLFTVGPLTHRHALALVDTSAYLSKTFAVAWQGSVDVESNKYSLGYFESLLGRLAAMDASKPRTVEGMVQILASVGLYSREAEIVRNEWTQLPWEVILCYLAGLNDETVSHIRSLLDKSKNSVEETKQLEVARWAAIDTAYAQHPFSQPLVPALVATAKYAFEHFPDIVTKATIVNFLFTLVANVAPAQDGSPWQSQSALSGMLGETFIRARMRTVLEALVKEDLVERKPTPDSAQPMKADDKGDR